MSAEERERKVALFVTCMVDALYPEIGVATVDLLERRGVQVLYPEEQTCCGQPAFNAGYRGEALDMARHFVEVFGRLIDSGAVHAVVAPSGSCVAMVRHYYDVLFEEAGNDAERDLARRVSGVTYELTEYLVRMLGVERLESSLGGTVTYHPCCHLLRGLAVDEEPRRLIKGLPGAEYVELPAGEECCGFGGVFSVKNAGISTAMGHRKTGHIASTGADTVVVNDVSCMTHLNGLLQREGRECRAVHVAEVLGGKAVGRYGGR